MFLSWPSPFKYPAIRICVHRPVMKCDEYFLYVLATYSLKIFSRFSTQNRIFIEFSHKYDLFSHKGFSFQYIGLSFAQTTGWKCTVFKTGSYRIISKIRCAMPLTYSLEKSQVTGEIELMALPQACLVAHWINMVEAENELPYCLSVVGIVQLLFAICFCISSHVPTTAFTWLFKFCTWQLSSIFLPISQPLMVQGFIFDRGLLIFESV